MFGPGSSRPPEGVEYAKTPAGEPCAHCAEAIADGDLGWIVPPGEQPFHHACFMRGIIGSVAHQARLCSCYVPGSQCGDDASLSRRGAAQAALEFHQITHR